MEQDDDVSVEVNGSTIRFDEVIITSPLGWLQSNKHLFEPALPSRLSSAISNIGYGNLDKVYITFASAFWEHANHQGTGGDVSTQQDIPNTTATAAPHHQSGDNKYDEHYPGFTLFYSNKDYDGTDSGIHNSMNMAGLPATCAHPSLLFYVFGECAKEIGRLVADTLPGKLDAKLIDYFRPQFSLMPGYSQDDPACQPRAAFATNWSSDELAGYGSYSTMRTGLEEGDEDIECMRHGMPERHVWLAGEHTAPFVALGTVTVSVHYPIYVLPGF
jgi:hypothetical protein